MKYRQDSSVLILFRIIRYCFDDGRVPNEWTKGIINPIFKGGDSSNPLNYTPITLLSAPCKIYTDILNRRLTAVKIIMYFTMAKMASVRVGAASIIFTLSIQ